MASIDFQKLLSPASPDEPCGPDLEFDAESTFSSFLGDSDRYLPGQPGYGYFNFNPSHEQRGFKFEEELDAAGDLLAVSRDLRVAVLVSKLLILRKDFSRFARSIGFIADLLETQWEFVYPRGLEDDYTLRTNTLEGLEMPAQVILPLQYATLFEHQRFGRLVFRAQLVSLGEEKLREGETLPDSAAMEQILEAEDEESLAAKTADARLLADAIPRIQKALADHKAESVAFEKLKPLASRIAAFLEAALARRRGEDVPAEAAAGDGQAPAGSSYVETLEQASRALAAAGAYFRASEPSSPALLLIQRAQLLVGKSFVEIVRLLVPEMYDQVKFQIGSRQTFTLPLSLLAEDAAVPDDAPDAPADDTAPEESSAMTDDEPATPEGSEDAAASDAAAGDETNPESQPEAAGEAAETKTHEPPPPDRPSPAAAPKRAARFSAANRNDALSLLLAVGNYYQKAEPASPIPFLLERARRYASSDFIGVLRDVLPANTLFDPDKKD